jgi:multiple sugar transport system ATP-binding protein
VSAVLRDGVLQQCDTPSALYERPANASVAGFIGSPAMNLDTVPVTGDGAVLGGLSVPVPGSVGARVTVGVRPESLRLAEEGIDLTVELVEELGADAYVYGTAPSGRTTGVSSCGWTGVPRPRSVNPCGAPCAMRGIAPFRSRNG